MFDDIELAIYLAIGLAVASVMIPTLIAWALSAYLFPATTFFIVFVTELILFKLWLKKLS